MNFDNNYVKINFDNFPCVVIAIKDHKPTETEFNEFLDAMKETYSNGKNRIVLFDLLNAQNIPFALQLKFAKWSKSMEANFAKNLKGVTFAVSNRFIQALLKSIFLLQKPNYEFKVFYKQNEVEAHQEQLKALVY